MDLGYKDCNVNMLTLSRTLCISKNDLSQFFDQCLHSNFRIWLSEIRLNEEKKMMLEGIPEGNIDSVCNQSGGIIKKKTMNRIVASANRGKTV